MSEFSVIAGAIGDMAGRMDGISPGADELHGRTAVHASAGGQTAAEDAISGLMTRWAAALPQFAASGERLAAAMRGAAAAYQQADAAVGRAASDGTGGGS